MSSVQKITLVVAVSENGGIGRMGKLPWHLPADLAFFKSYTMGKPLVMGRNTFASLGFRPLPGRQHLILSSTLAEGPGYKVYPDLVSAVSDCAKEPEIIIAGGAAVYAMALPIATDLCINRIHCTVEADTFFPAFAEEEWALTHSEYRAPDEKNAYGISFMRYRRISEVEESLP
jgi:dihydrofolate reductase